LVKTNHPYLRVRRHSGASHTLLVLEQLGPDLPAPLHHHGPELGRRLGKITIVALLLALVLQSLLRPRVHVEDEVADLDELIRGAVLERADLIVV
jgi:hypothetical protein